MIIDHSLKIVLLHVPKCAGTSLRQAFLEDGRERDVVSFFDFEYNPVLHRQVDKAHLPLMDLRHFPEWRFLKRYQVIACIRHPYERLASACREFLRQNSRETEVQMRTQLPSQEQRLAYLRRLPAAMDAHDLRWVHGFPIHWFTHYGKRAKVQHLIRCSDLAEDLEHLGARLQWPQSLRTKLSAVGAGTGRRQTADLDDLSHDPNLRAMANLLHSNDFRCFGFARSDASIDDPDLADHVQRCLRVGPSHELPLTNLTPQMRWYYGRSSNRHEPVLQPIHRRRQRR